MNILSPIVDISLSATGTWTDINLSSYVPSGTSGVIIRVVNTSASMDINWGLRAKGSTDEVYFPLFGSRQTTIYVSADSNRFIQGKISDTQLDFYLVGYFLTEATFFTNGIDKTPSVFSSWQDIDCSANVPVGTVFGIFEWVTQDMGFGCCFRKKGSTDNRVSEYSVVHGGWLVALDTDRKCQVNIEISGNIYLKGYINSADRAIAKTNGLNVSLTTTGSYESINLSTDIPIPPFNIAAAIIEPNSALLSTRYALRKPGDSDDLYYKSLRNDGNHVIGITGNAIEGKIEATDLDFYVMGYLGGEPINTGTVDINTPLLTAAGGGFWIEPNYMILPLPTINGYSPKITNDAGVSIPLFSISSSSVQGYSSVADLTFPALTISVTEPVTLSGILSIPKLTSTGEVYSSAVVNGSMTLPKLTANAIILASNVGNASFDIPKLTILANTSAKGDVTFLSLGISANGFSGTLSDSNYINLPKLESIGSMISSTYGLITSNINIGLPTVTALGIHGNIGSLTKNLRLIKINSNGYTGNVGNGIVEVPIIDIGNSLSYGEYIGSGLLTFPNMLINIILTTLTVDNSKVYCINLKTFTITQYTNYGFNSMCNFKGMPFGANSYGIYLLSGDTDDGTAISSEILTGASDVKTSNLKRYLDAYISMTGVGNYSLKVINDDSSKEYAFVGTKTTIDNIKVNLNKGEKGNFSSIGFKNVGGSKFNLNNIGLNVSVLKRKI